MFRQRGREEEREGEKHQCMVAFLMPPTGNLARHPGMCPDWETNQPHDPLVSRLALSPLSYRATFLKQLSVKGLKYKKYFMFTHTLTFFSV